MGQYLETANVQAWLQRTKFKISSVDSEFASMAQSYIFGELSQRYNTSLWLDSTDTPKLILHLLAMQIASYELRRGASEEDGRTTYADSLDKRVMDMVASILSGAVVLTGVVEVDTGIGAGPGFFPSNGTELLDVTDPNYAPRYFSMGYEF